MTPGTSPSLRLPPVILAATSAFAIGLVLYGITYLYPAFNALNALNTAITNERGNLERFKILSPVQARAGALDKIRFKDGFEFPKRIRLPRKELTRLYTKFRTWAMENRLELTGSHFDINALDKDSDTLFLTLELNGNLDDFRQFLIKTISWQAFDSISTLEIRPGTGQNRQISVGLMLNIQPNIQKNRS